MKIILLFITLLSCTSNAKTIPTVGHVDINKYLGKWYEIARFDQKFQKDCTAVTAQYRLRKDGDIKVINTCRLYSPDGQIKKATGRAWVTQKNTNSKLRVQFFLNNIKLPFLSGKYWILDLGKNYEYSLVGAPNKKYLWILARTPELEDHVLNSILDKAELLGFDTSKLIYTTH